MSQSSARQTKIGLSLTALSLLAMLVGICLGIVAHDTGNGYLLGAARGLEPLVLLWTNALRMVIVPLVCSYLFLAIAKPKDVRRTGRAVVFAFAIFSSCLVAGTLVTLLISPGLLSSVFGQLEGVGFGEVRVPVPAEVSQQVPRPIGMSEWVSGLIPASLPKAIVEERMLPLLLAMLMIAFAATRLENRLRDLLLDLFQAIADLMMTLVHWILRFVPLAVLAISFSMATETGAELIGPLGIYVAAVSLLLLSATLPFYGLAILVGGIAPLNFVRGLFPAQMVAIGTRSSMACLQPLMDGATKRMGLPMEQAELAIPLSVSVFRLNVSISSPFKLLFLAHVYGIPLAGATLVSFLVANLLLSFGSPGIPTRVVGTRLPFYMAAGIPAEGVILLGAIDAIPDIFKTLLNVTASMSVATLVARLFGRELDKAQLAVQPTTA